MPVPFNITIPPLITRRTASTGSSASDSASELNQRHSFKRLRSFYLSPSPTKQEFGLAPSNAGTEPSTPQSAVFQVECIQRGSDGAAPVAGDACSERTLRERECKRKASERSLYQPDLALPPSPRSPRGRTLRACIPGRGRRSLSSFYSSWGREGKRRVSGKGVMLCVLGLALFMVMCLALAFVGAGRGDNGVLERFGKALDGVARDDPGIVLVGENVDVDIDEPSVEIRWTVLACGEAYVLPGSGNSRSECGLPFERLDFYIDGEEQPVGSYDPKTVPHPLRGYRQRTSDVLGGAPHKFTTTHTLDVHRAWLYPFDTYNLAFSLRAFRPSSPGRGGLAVDAGATNVTGIQSATGVELIPIKRVVLENVGVGGSWDVESLDGEGWAEGGEISEGVEGGGEDEEDEEELDEVSISNGTSTTVTPSPSGIVLPSTSPPIATASPQHQSQPRRRRELPPDSLALSSGLDTAPPNTVANRIVTLHITRPASTQAFTILLFAVSWVLVHFCVVLVVLVWRRSGMSTSTFMAESSPKPTAVAAGERSMKIFFALLSHFGVLLSIVSMRNSMPDAPGLDGVLLDCIGFFPQVVVVGACLGVVLFVVVAREFDEGQADRYRRSDWDDAGGDDGGRVLSSYSFNAPSHIRPGREQDPSRHQQAKTEPCCRASIISSFPQPPSTTPTPHTLFKSPTAPTGPTHRPTPPHTACPLGASGYTCRVSASESSGSSWSGAADIGSHSHSPFGFGRYHGGRRRNASDGATTASPPVSPTSPTGMGIHSPGLMSPTSPTSLASPMSPTTPMSPPMSPRSAFGFASRKGFWSPPASPSIRLGNVTGLKRKVKGGEVEMGLRGKAGTGQGERRRRSGSWVRKGGQEGEEVSRWSDHEDD